MKQIVVLCLIYMAVLSGSKAQDSFPELSGPYFGEIAPKEKAEVFMNEIISTLADPEMCAGFTFDGKEFYYNALYNDNWTIFATREINGRWTKPVPVNFSAGYTDRDFTISPDGSKIYFGSDRPRVKDGEKLNRLDIFVSERIEHDKWSEPRNMGAVINTDYSENYPSVDAEGNLYFFSNRGEGLGGCEIYKSNFVEGLFQTPELMNDKINSDKHDWDSFIAPDQSFIIWSSQNRDDTIGKQDLYISFQNENGEWTKGVNMGPRVNSTGDEICPSVSLDGKYLFFTSRRRGAADIYWIDADIIDDLK